MMFDWLYPYADKLRFPDEVVETQFRKDYHADTVFTTRLALARPKRGKESVPCLNLLLQRK
jgi:hypothetical protein